MLIAFINRVVSQMLVYTVQIGLCWRLVLASAKSHQPVLVDKHAQRIDAHHEAVDAQIELVAVDQQWILYVLLFNTHILICIYDIIDCYMI